MGILMYFVLSLSASISAEERLSWFTTDPEIKKRIFVPDNLSEGKEENRVLPWVFHDIEERKILQLKCIMRGYNVSNNPSDYKDARWSYPGFSDSQVNISSLADKGEENGVPYAIWTIAINTSAADAGKKWATCEFQQGDFPLSTDFTFLIFRKMSKEENVVLYEFGGFLDEKNINNQLEDDIKKQISDHYSLPASSVNRSSDGQKFVIKVPTTEDKPVEFWKKCTKEDGSSPLNGAYTQKICVIYHFDRVERIETRIFFKRLSKYK